ncbi:MAG: hypothetical protein CMD65_02705, partial [Gammaproteobacteria bacterium]|nr:hypothetical protein [Gammaproteobacteria bacterium]
FVDNVTFLVKGSPGAWADLLWPHRWALYTEEAYINNARVWDYNLNLEQGGYFTVGTLCHEFFHSLGSPDLYHYWDTSAPVAVGGWDVMDASSEIPQSMSAYMKYRYTEWINELPIIEYGGTYELYPLSNPENNIYRINSPIRETEYFVLEYRVQEGLYEVNTPGDKNGLIIYRINDEYSGQGNGNGPPDEIYVYRTGATLNSGGIFAGAVFSEEVDRIEFNDNTDPNCFLHDGMLGGINVSNVGMPEETIHFDVVNMMLFPEFSNLSFDTDEDYVVNPGEEILLDVSVSNLSNFDADEVVLTISSLVEGIEILNNPILFGNINNGDVGFGTALVGIDNDVFGDVVFDVEVASLYEENNAQLTYIDNFQLILNVSLNQFGFPVSTLNEIRSAPLVVDLDLDGEKEIIFGDHFGFINAVNSKGVNVLTDIFPFDTGGQIWGAPALGDIDLDGYEEVVFVSSSKNIYVFDYTGLKWSYETESLLISTPSLANINNDEYIEIIFSGYSNNNTNYFALSHDGVNINEINLTEKSRSGFAVGDFNNNQFDDVVFGTDENKIYLIYDNVQVAEGFPFETNNKFQLAPVMLNQPHKNTILAACKNKTLYSIEDDGSIDFIVEFDDYISTSPSILYNNDQILIFIGNNNGDIYGIDLEGNIVFEFNIGSKVIGSITFSDLNADEIPEIISVNDIGDLHVINLNGEYYPHFPIHYDFPYSSTCSIDDLDLDLDLEVLCGTTNSLIAIDIKENGGNANYWNMYSGNPQRTNYYKVDYNCNYGDIDLNEYINVFDIILLVECILLDSCSICSDVNIDGSIDIIDVIDLVNMILEF